MTQMQLQLGDSIQERFERFHEQHPEVYDYLVKTARELHSRGRTHFGIRALWERARWYFTFEYNPCKAEDYKFNDHFHSRYARLIMQREPDLKGLFEQRRIRTA